MSLGIHSYENSNVVYDDDDFDDDAHNGSTWTFFKTNNSRGVSVTPEVAFIVGFVIVLAMCIPVAWYSARLATTAPAPAVTTQSAATVTVTQKNTVTTTAKPQPKPLGEYSLDKAVNDKLKNATRNELDSWYIGQSRQSGMIADDSRLFEMRSDICRSLEAGDSIEVLAQKIDQYKLTPHQFGVALGASMVSQCRDVTVKLPQ